MELGYWKIRGLAQPIRMLLIHCGADYKDIIYECTDEPEYSKEAWLSVKHTLNLDFPNLPYIMDGDVRITQSNAIMRYIARKYGLAGKSEKEYILIDLIENQAMDLRNGFVRLCYGSDYQKNSENYKLSIKSTFMLFDAYLSDKAYFAGDNITYVDFIMYELLDQHELFQNNILEDYTNIKKFMNRFKMDILEVLESEKLFKGPINNKTANFK